MSVDSSHVLIAGCGYVGGRLAWLLVQEGRRVWGLKRNPVGLPDGVEPLAADVTDRSSLGGLPSPDALVYAVSPADRTEDAYRSAYVDGLRNVLDALRETNGPVGRVVLVSSTGVYGQSDGRWVDEDSDPEPRDPTARRILEGEAVARAAGSPGIVLRLGGIYGPGRTRTVRRVLDGEAGCPPPDRYGNRIHRDDAAAAILHLLALEDPAPLYLGVDRDPAPLREVYQWVARRVGAADPCRGGSGNDPEPAASRRSNKRCSSRRLAGSGFTFAYPSFREGYGPIADRLVDGAD